MRRRQRRSRKGLRSRAGSHGSRLHQTERVIKEPTLISDPDGIDVWVNAISVEDGINRPEYIGDRVSFVNVHGDDNANTHVVCVLEISRQIIGLFFLWKKKGGEGEPAMSYDATTPGIRRTTPDPSYTNYTEIVPRLFLGNRRVADDAEWLKAHGIGVILNCALEIPNKFEPETYCETMQAAQRQLAVVVTDALHLLYINYLVYDTPEADLGQYFEEAYTEIAYSLDSTDDGVLVHCAAGVSRSSTIVIAYIMSAYAMTFARALQFVKERRPCVRPNKGFVAQLMVWERRCGEMTRGPSDV